MYFLIDDLIGIITTVTVMTYYESLEGTSPTTIPPTILYAEGYKITKF